MTLIFVKAGNRFFESTAGLARLGIGLGRQKHLHLQDGALWASQETVSDVIEETVALQGITRVVTLGANGYDNHPDHITTHLAAESAIKRLRSVYDKDIGWLALSNTHTGTHRVPADVRPNKLVAMAAHECQFRIRAASDHGFSNYVSLDGFAIEADFWKGFRQYHPLILSGETYDRL